MRVHVLLYDSGKDSEGIHSLEISGQTIVLMFENLDDAERYCGLLEAQDFPLPTVEAVDKEEIENFCLESGYEAKFVESGFIPKTQSDRFLIAPPERNLDVTNWNKENDMNKPLPNDDKEDISINIEELKKKFEDLL